MTKRKPPRTARAKQAADAGEARVLEMVAAGAPLDETLDALVRMFEAQADGMLASVLLWDPLESTCRHASLSIL